MLYQLSYFRNMCIFSEVVMLTLAKISFYFPFWGKVPDKSGQVMLYQLSYFRKIILDFRLTILDLSPIVFTKK